MSHLFEEPPNPLKKLAIALYLVFWLGGLIAGTLGFIAGCTTRSGDMGDNMARGITQVVKERVK